MTFLKVAFAGLILSCAWSATGLADGAHCRIDEFSVGFPVPYYSIGTIEDNSLSRAQCVALGEKLLGQTVTINSEFTRIMKATHLTVTGIRGEFFAADGSITTFNDAVSSPSAQQARGI